MGSITKLWAATQIMLLAEQGRVTVDTPVWRPAGPAMRNRWLRKCRPPG
ncbi:hypothetical protein [Microbispora bryophytorum]